MSRAFYGVGATGGAGYDFTPTVLTANEGFVIYRPQTRPAYGTKGVIFLIHGAGGSAIQAGSGGTYEGLGNYLTNTLGFTVLAADFGSNGNAGGATTNPDTMGSNVAMAAMDAAFKWATGLTTSGTSTGSSASTLTDTGQVWRGNQWRGRTITAGGKTGVIASNTSTILTLTAAGWTGGTPASTSVYTIGSHFTDINPDGKPGKIGIIGASMGSWIARNWASRNTSKVAFIIDIAGVVDAPFVYGTGGAGSIIDYGYGPAAPAAPTISGTAGAQGYLYKIVPTCALGDGPPSPASTSFAGVTVASLGATPNTVNWVQPAAATSAQPITGYKILRSIDAGTSYQNVGSVGTVATFNDNVTGAGSAYTQLAANGTSVTLGAYGVNGAGANPSYDPLAATNLTAGLKAIPLQYWWSANDGTTSTGSGVPGTVNTEVQTFKAAYGANAVLQEIPTDPVHNNTVAGIGLSPAALGTMGAFINTNQP
jgi:hypothetical protein